MTDADIRTLSLTEIRRMRDEGKLEPATEAAEAEIDDPSFWERAELVEHPKRRSVHLRLDPEVFDFFIAATQGKGHIRKMQAVLAAYARAHRSDQTG